MHPSPSPPPPPRATGRTYVLDKGPKPTQWDLLGLAQIRALHCKSLNTVSVSHATYVCGGCLWSELAVQTSSLLFTCYTLGDYGQ